MSSERSPFEIAAAVADMKTEIQRDIAAGIIPADVDDFVALHDHVDANDYAGFTDPNRRAEWDVPDLVAVQEAVHEWLKAGRREPVDAPAAPAPEEVSQAMDMPPKWVGGRVKLVIEATVSAAEYRDFVAAHVARGRAVHESFDARMDEVFSPGGDVLTSVQVKSVRVVP